MNIVAKLALAHAQQHPARVCLSSLAMIAAACVVVWVVSGYDALVAQFDEMASDYLGRYDLMIVPDSPKQPAINPELLGGLQQDPAVAAIDPVFLPSTRATVGRPDRRGQPAAPHRGGPQLVGTNAPQPPYPMVEGDWIDPQRPDRMEAVVSSSSAQRLEVVPGDEVLVTTGDNQVQLRVLGIVEEVSRVAASATGRGGGPSPARGLPTAALYVPVPLAEQITGEPAELSVVNVALDEGADLAGFKSRWADRLAETSPAAAIITFEELRQGLEEGRTAARTRNQAYAATGLSLLAGFFIIFTTLSMGVSERVRQLAILRAVAWTRGQVALLIASESLLLAVVGWVGGLAAGWALLGIVRAAEPELFPSGASLGPWCVTLAGVCALGGTLGASVLPAWRATRVSPLEAMSPGRRHPPARWTGWAAAVGLALIAVNPLLVFVVPMPDESRWGIYAALGCTSMAIGFLLMAPLAIVATERLLGPLVAALAGVDRRMLATQLSSNLWRTLGTTAAMTVGLGLFVATMIWGYSMLVPFVPGDWVPEVLVAFPLGGLPDSEIDNVRHLEGVIPEECLPLAVEQPKLVQDLTHSEQRETVARQDNIVLVGLDPQAGLGGPDPLLDLEFVAGTRDEAVAKLKQGRWCIVPDHFAEAAGLALGDRLGLIPPESPQHPVEYTIAGVVSLPGWHWMTKFSGLRRRSGRSAAMVFAAFDDVRRDFQLEKINFFWLNTDQHVGINQLGAALGTIAERNLGPRQPVNAQGTWSSGATMFGESVRITTPADISNRINTRADGMIWGMCQLPLITLLVTSLGVVNAVMASIRARRWELGVMRAVGLTRMALTRLILAEGVLIGLVACLLSLAFGVVAGWCGTGISQYVSFFGGLETPLVIPWLRIALGLGATVALCLAAALWPAVSTGRTEPLRLLQAGRAA
jgi:putative ABC transport system permease protein